MHQPAEPRQPRPRFVPHIKLPPYAHTPGVTAHPLRNPDGHSFGQSHPTVNPPDSSAWRECEPYLWGIDLFNAGYYWEAHETWESAWIAAGRRGPTADFLKALIKLAAAGVKLREGIPAGAQRHLLRAEELLTGLLKTSAPGSRTFGLTLSSLAQACRDLRAGPLPVAPDQSRPIPLLDVELQPE